MRKGDTLSSIAQKREVPLEQLLKLNHNTSPDALVEGQTLLLPSGKLSARDKEILEGIGPWTYRTYPVRAGENLNVSCFGLFMCGYLQAWHDLKDIRKLA